VIVQRAADRLGVPWRNGLGVQYEIDADHVSDWSWRLSTADIDRDVPFSQFPGVHRVFCVGGGLGVTLWVNGAEVSCGPRSIARFDGDSDVLARIWDGPVQAINLMWRDGARWRDLQMGEAGDVLVGAFAVVATGSASVTIGDVSYELGHLDAVLHVDDAHDVNVVRGAVAAVVRADEHVDSGAEVRSASLEARN